MLGLLIIASLFVGLIFVLKRNFLHMLMGIILLGNAANLIFYFANSPKINSFPFIRDLTQETSKLADPLPQALILTAIVISFALFCLQTAIFKSALIQFNIKGDDDILEEGFEELKK